MQAPNTLTPDESQDLLAALTSIRNKALGRFMLEAGLRIAETVHLLRSDLWISDAPVHTLWLRPQVAKYRCGRLIPLTATLQESIAALQSWIWQQLPHHYTDWAFQGPNPQHHLSTRQARRIISALGIQACHRHINPHMLRHTFATRLMQTTNIRIVQQLLGHKNLSSTQIYTHPNHQDLRKAIDQLHTHP